MMMMIMMTTTMVVKMMMMMKKKKMMIMMVTMMMMVIMVIVVVMMMMMMMITTTMMMRRRMLMTMGRCTMALPQARERRHAALQLLFRAAPQGLQPPDALRSPLPPPWGHYAASEAGINGAWRRIPCRELGHVLLGGGGTPFFKGKLFRRLMEHARDLINNDDEEEVEEDDDDNCAAAADDDDDNGNGVGKMMMMMTMPTMMTGTMI